MAFIECNCFSDVLGKNITMWVVLPQNAQRRIGISGKRSAAKKHPVLYLLHGLSDDQTIWMRHTSIERYAEETGLAVVMPCVDRSFYTDMASGYDYWKFISREVPLLASEFFPISDKRSESFVAGLSMGGYGAFKLGLLMPERFAAVASLSGALDMAVLNTVDNGMEKDIRLVYGNPVRIKGTENDLVGLVKRTVHQKGLKPLFYQWCGTEDFLYQENINFRKAAEKAGLPLTYEEGPGGHEWKCWDTQIQRVISWLPLKKNR